MKAGSLLLFLIAASLQLAYAAQSGELGSGIAGLGNGVSIHIVTKAEPPEKAPALKFGNSYQVGDGILHRSVSDAVNHTSFGYDLHVEPTADAGRCRVAILPLSRVATQPVTSGATSATAGGVTTAPVETSRRIVLLPNYPAPQVVSDGDTIALDLLTTSDGQQKVVDYIEVSCKVRWVSASPASSDASLDDLQMALTDPNVYVNGTFVSGPAKGVRMNGNLVWFYLQGKGRFIFSLLPRQDRGFVRAGTVHDNVISFAFGNTQYEIRNSATVFGSGRQFNLYVLNEPLFEARSSPSFGKIPQVEGDKK